MHTVLEYCLDGNLENEFVPQKNLNRNWYHAPWMSLTTSGREPVHGLTFERPALMGYLADTQTRVCQSWAVAMYNEEGEEHNNLHHMPACNKVHAPLSKLSIMNQ